MLISTKGRYGLRAMFELAKSYGQGAKSLRQIAGAQGISEHYLEQLFLRLKGAELVRSKRGAGGGYVLAYPPSETSVGSILTALEGELVPAECVGSSAKCQNAGACSTHAMWRRIYDGLSTVVHGITLADMLEDERRLAASAGMPKNIRC